MMQGDDIQKQRQHAEHWCSTVVTFESRAALALWVIAEQLYEIRQLISISLERNK